MRHLTLSALLIVMAEMASLTAGAKTYKPSAPIALLATRSPRLPGAVELSWPAVKGASEYTISASRETDGNWQNLGTTSSTEYQVNELPEGTKYYFRIASNTSGEQSPWSDTSIQYTSETKDFRPGLLLLPQNFHMGAGAGSDKGTAPRPSGELAMEWSAVVGARSYAVQLCESQARGDTPGERGVLRRSGSAESCHDLSIVPETKFLSTGLRSGNSYRYRIAGIDAKGQRGAYSQVLDELAP